jgi:hypothetical protein
VLVVVRALFFCGRSYVRITTWIARVIYINSSPKQQRQCEENKRSEGGEIVIVPC